MYKYMNDVEIIINNMLDVFGINVKKSATFYKSRINNFLKFIWEQMVMNISH